MLLVLLYDNCNEQMLATCRRCTLLSELDSSQGMFGSEIPILYLTYALNRSLYGLKVPRKTPHEPKIHPFKADRRHQIWSVDLRYIERHRLGDDKPVYIISILDNFSRAILASGISKTQNLTDYFIVLFAAIRQHGAPEMIVSDSGSIFKAKQAMKIYAALEIQKEQIQKRQSWQDLIESQFNLQRRLADWDFAQDETWTQMLATHAKWVVDHNYQPHYAHKDRQDGRHSPAEVLGWKSGCSHGECSSLLNFSHRKNNQRLLSGTE